ncbi:hypothetical protein UA08_03909 [Talaromyces atroroseus]|uniref:Thioesterase domain-containing protein n=1 Tax=Talaromyces atroroseus TaxID=1441469 RepID=A0A225AYM3_TALAT|nr:hypothetical protein UA08_03909 [Talaromyces atroroseus]OKL60809.1 hypothetical protein UA08_03909 [Talaromyces atroroseus]
MSVPKVLSDAELAHFSSIPWAKSILQTSLQQQNHNGDYVAIDMPARTLKPPTDEDGYFGGTLATQQTIPYIVTLRRRNLESISSLLPTEPPVIDATSKRAFTPSRPPDTITLVSLSTPGLSGHTSTVHGGVVATLFDEAMYLAVDAYLSSSSSAHDHKIYTAQLNVRYRKPIHTPGLLVIWSWCVARAGRKTWTIAHAVQEEEEHDGGHLEWVKTKTLRSEASSLWVATRDEKL